MTRCRPCLLALAIVLASPSAFAAEIGSEGDVASVEVHAFVSQGFILSSGNNYLASESKNGSFQFTEAGINFTKPITDKLRVGLQLFASDLGPNGNFNAKMDWFYLDYRFADWLGLRAGRVKLPFGLYNEINDVDSARVPILLPQSVYPQSNRDYLLAQTGGELYGYLTLGGAGALDYRAYGGTIFFDTTSTSASPYQVLSLGVPFVAGGRVLWETPLEGLRAGGSVQTLRIDTSLLAAGKRIDAEIPALLAVGSVEYAAHDLLLAAEYSRWHVKTDTSNTLLFPVSSVVSERAYAMASYRVNKWFQPGTYYSVLFPDTTKRSGRANVQHDVAATLRFDLTANWLLKLEAHYMAGTAGLTTSLNDNAPLDDLQRYWGVFLVKTTAYF